MSTIRRYAADHALVIDGSALRECPGDPLRETVIATGPGSVARKADARHAVRSARGQAEAMVDTLASNGMDGIEIPALPGKNAD